MALTGSKAPDSRVVDVNPTPTTVPHSPERADFDLRKATPIAAVVGALLLAFWPLVRILPDLWFSDDTYYAHGAVVPICAGLIVWDRWDKIKGTRLKGSAWAIPPLLAAVFGSWAASRGDMHLIQSTLFLAGVALTVAFILGWAWLPKLAVPIVYLSFGLPMFDRFVGDYTIPVQHLSTKLSFALLRTVGEDPFMTNTTTIQLNTFALDIGVPCSGMKLILAVTAIAIFFALVAHLRWWKNAILLAAIMPIALSVNVLRISLIGIVGNAYGSAAGHQFHDYSGYIALAVCFGLLYGLTKLMGWK